MAIIFHNLQNNPLKMANFDPSIQMLEEFHAEHGAEATPGPRNEQALAEWVTTRKKRTADELNEEKEKLTAEKEALIAQVEVLTLEYEELITQNEKLRVALWEFAKTLQGTESYDSFVALLQEHNIHPL